MANFIQNGETIDYTNTGAAIAYGAVVPLTTRIGIAGEAIATGATGGLHVTGIYEENAIAGAAFAVGEALYWDPVARNLTNVADGNIPAGWCTEPKAAAATRAKVKIG